MQLGVLASNTPARRLYESLGFVADPETLDAPIVLMAATFEPALERSGHAHRRHAHPFDRPLRQRGVRVRRTAPANARLIFLAGSCPLNLDGTTAGIGDYAAQAAKCVENMTIALREAGAGLTDVVSTRVLVASPRQADLVAAWEVVREAFGEHEVPSTLLGVTVLGTTTSLWRSRRWRRSSTARAQPARRTRDLSSNEGRQRSGREPTRGRHTLSRSAS